MVRLTDHLDVTVVVDLDVQSQTKHKIELQHDCLHLCSYISCGKEEALNFV